jgi:hypothetical protein
MGKTGQTGRVKRKKKICIFLPVSGAVMVQLRFLFFPLCLLETPIHVSLLPFPCASLRLICNLAVVACR